MTVGDSVYPAMFPAMSHADRASDLEACGMMSADGSVNVWAALWAVGAQRS